MMGLVFRHNNVYEKRVTEMGFAVMCLSIHKVFLTFSRVSFCAYSMCKKIVNAIGDDDIFLW